MKNQAKNNPLISFNIAHPEEACGSHCLLACLNIPFS